MRSLDSARDSWGELKQCRDIQALRVAVRLDGHTSAPTSGLRSACWKAFLLFEDVATPSWPRTLLSSRSAYNSLRMHFLRRIENPDEHADPLSDETDSLHKDHELRAEIQQDVDRCMPENLYFRQPQTQRMLLDILFVYSKLNPDVSYRQGMHELLAPVLWVVERDAIDLGQSSKAMGEDAVVKAVYDADHIEHDTFAVFAQIMQSAKNFYEQTTHQGSENPMVSRSKRIVFDLLSQLDAELAQHLEKLDIVPQVFLMRWIRLLFGREYAFDDMLTMWDVIFAEDASLELVDHICLTMLLRIRWELLESDYNGVLTLLLRYPAPDKDFAPQQFVLDALYLRDHMHPAGGSYLVLKYSGRPLQPAGRPVTPPALQRNITAFSGVNAAKAALGRTAFSPDRKPKQARNIEAILQSTAKGIYARGEQFGIGKAVRSAVGEVQRKAQEIRDTQTPSPPARPRGPRTASGVAFSRVKELEARNAQLGMLLESAVAELWECQKLVAERTSPSTPREEENHHSEAGLEKLSLAIAKVQFVQVYLGDSSLPLPDDEAAKSAGTLLKEPADDKSLEQRRVPTVISPIAEHTSPPPSNHDYSNEKLADPSSFDDPEETPPTPNATTQSTSPPPFPSSSKSTRSHKPQEPPSDYLTAQPLRPPLAESSYSWMLGQDTTVADKPNSTTHPEPAGTQSPAFSALLETQRRNRGFLFGDSASSSDILVKRAKHRKTPSSASKVEDDEDVFDMGSLRRHRPV